MSTESKCFATLAMQSWIKTVSPSLNACVYSLTRDFSWYYSQFAPALDVFFSCVCAVTFTPVNRVQHAYLRFFGTFVRWWLGGDTAVNGSQIVSFSHTPIKLNVTSTPPCAALFHCAYLVSVTSAVSGCDYHHLACWWVGEHIEERKFFARVRIRVRVN